MEFNVNGRNLAGELNFNEAVFIQILHELSVERTGKEEIRLIDGSNFVRLPQSALCGSGYMSWLKPPSVERIIHGLEERGLVVSKSLAVDDNATGDNSRWYALSSEMLKKLTGEP